MTKDSLPSLAALPSCLPFHAEEGPAREECTRVDLETALAGSRRLTVDQARLAVALLERLFDAASLLDRRALERGAWSFVSYPAYLFARSIAESLAADGTRYVPVEYWEQGSHRPDEVKEQQRAILRCLEEGRRQNSQRGAQPIRFVWVAWGIIRLGGKFLLRHREDKTRPEVKNFVLPGGRLSLADLPEGGRPREAYTRLRVDAPFADAALRKALKRELAEELSLIESLDYVVADWRSLAPYCAVEGTGNSHALSEYRIRLWAIRLTAEGEVKLFDHIARNDQQFCWFTPEELARQQLPDGRRAYVDAMTTDWGTRTLETLSQAPDSTAIGHRFANETDALDVPVRRAQAFRRGKTGKEREIWVPLDDFEEGILLALAWHAKLPGNMVPVPGVTLLPTGWVKIGNSDIGRRARGLIGTLESAGLPIVECARDDFFRINVDPVILYFNEAAFSYRLKPADDQGRHYVFELSIASFETALGQLRAPTSKWSITRNVQRILVAIESGKEPDAVDAVKSGDIPKVLRDSLDQRARELGLRKVVRTPNKRYEIAVARAS